MRIEGKELRIEDDDLSPFFGFLTTRPRRAPEPRPEPVVSPADAVWNRMSPDERAAWRRRYTTDMWEQYDNVAEFAFALGAR